MLSEIFYTSRKKIEQKINSLLKLIGCKYGMNTALRTLCLLFTTHKWMHMKKVLINCLLAVTSTVALNAAADSALFPGEGIGPGGIPVSASALIDFSGDYMTITLRNTSPANLGADVPGSTLTGFFWQLSDRIINQPLTPISALVAEGSSILGICSEVSCAGVTNVGGEFGFAYQTNGFPRGTNWGIASSGYLTTGLTANLGNFNGINLDDPKSLDGINFGIVSSAAGYAPNGGLEKVPVIQDAVVFKLSGATGLQISDIVTGNFQYGTSFSELNVLDDIPTQTPEPPSLALLMLGLLGLGAAQRSRKSTAGKTAVAPT
jgi:hypothetical protein